MFYVYILRSLVNGRFYIGSTNNLERRIYEHNNGKSKYTSLTKPFALIHEEKHPNRREAAQRERFLKSGKGREWIYKSFRWSGRPPKDARLAGG